MVRSGFHKVDITPPAGVPLAGYAARQGVSTGTHDPLFARALVLESDGRPAVFVSLDVLGVSEDFVRTVRARIRARTGLPPEAVNISATHTHAGPVTMRAFCHPHEQMDPAYGDRLTAAIEEAVCVAWEGRSPSRVGVGTGRATDVGVNRRSADGRPVDEEVGLIKIEDAEGRTRGTLVNFACHPTVLGPDNLLATADFPAYTVSRIEERLGPGSFALFVNGAEGNVSMGHSSELSAIGVITPGRTFDRAESLGYRLADAVLTALPAIACEPDLAITSERSTLHLPLKAYPPPDLAAAALARAKADAERLVHANAAWEEIARARTRRLYASIDHYFAVETRRNTGDGLPVEVQAVRLGNALFVTAPAEIFVEIGLRMKREARHPLFILGLTNGYIAYLPSRSAYAADGYEVVSSAVTGDAEDRLVGHVREIEERMFA